MRTGLALAIVLFIAVPLPASAEQGPPLAEPAFAAIAAELRTSAKAREAQIERCTESRTGALPSSRQSFAPTLSKPAPELSRASRLAVSPTPGTEYFGPLMPEKWLKHSTEGHHPTA